jgi:xanthosine utilization system XapX-like protein
MESIRKHRNGYALLLATSICLAVLLGVKFMLEAAFAFCAISVVSLMLLVRQICLLHDATLIWDNRILAVPSACISTIDGEKKNDRSEAIVSTFGILIGSKIYRWGLDGVHGVRLNAARIDKERMYLTFGNAANTMRVELLHGMVEYQEVLDVKQKLLHETGVTADITGW